MAQILLNNKLEFYRGGTMVIQEPLDKEMCMEISDFVAAAA